MSFIADTLFRVYAVCCQQLHRPIRVHLKYSEYNSVCTDNDALTEEIKKNFACCEVNLTKEKSPFLLNNYEIWVVGGDLIWSRRNGDGKVDTEEKREKIIEAIRKALEGACPASCNYSCGGTRGPCGDVH